MSTDPPNAGRQAIANQIAGFVGAAQALVSALPLPDPVKAWLNASVINTRNTLFNQAPFLSPYQISADGTVPITGSLGAVDVEGDPMVFAVTRNPTYGTVVINTDGTFVYTPGSSFAGTDTFGVSATDLGTHINLLDLFRSPSTTANLLVNKSAVTFVFNYTTGSDYWTTDARAALQRAASNLVAYFLVTTPVVLTYDITGSDSSTSRVLASASSALISAGPGFLPTVVQEKLLTGTDANGSTADGAIDWNFAYPWAFGDTVTSSQYDFITVAMHELTHSLGFGSYVTQPSNGTHTYSLYDEFLQDAAGNKLIDPTTLQLNPTVVPELTSAIYFGGADAVAAYGALVPVFTPNPWVQGSSLSHLDSNTFSGNNQKLMNPSVSMGLGLRALSPVELGIMQDLGYTLAPQSATSTLAFVGFVFIRRRRRFAETDIEQQKAG